MIFLSIKMPSNILSQSTYGVRFRHVSMMLLWYLHAGCTNIFIVVTHNDIHVKRKISDCKTRCPCVLCMYRQITKSLSISSSPSAFQIRYGGCKGVVSVCPDLEDDQLHVRESMEKFKSDHQELEVVQYTKPGKLVRLFLFTVVFCVSQFGYLGYCLKWHVCSFYRAMLA